MSERLIPDLPEIFVPGVPKWLSARYDEEYNVVYLWHAKDQLSVCVARQSLGPKTIKIAIHQLREARKYKRAGGIIA